jgi:hypothetical protein
MADEPSFCGYCGHAWAWHSDGACHAPDTDGSENCDCADREEG